MLKRLVLLTAMIAILAAVPASALDFDQKQMYGRGVLALPMGNFGDFANLGIGAGLGMLVPHTPNISFRGEISYIYFTTEDFSFAGESADVSASMIPVNALIQYNLTDSKVYLLGGLGLAFAKLSVDFPSTSDLGFGSTSSSDTSTEIGVTLGAGTQLKSTLGLEGRLSLISDANSISGNLIWWF